MMTKEESTKIVNFMTPRAEILVLGHGHISHVESSLHPDIDQTSNDDQGRVYQICKFHDSLGRGSCVVIL